MNGHQSEDSIHNTMNRLEAAARAATFPPCIHCHSSTRPLPMAGDSWGVEIFHEVGCPLHEESRRAVEPS